MTLLWTLALLLSAPIQGQNFDWVGTTSSDWNTASNWSPSGIPAAGAHVRLNAGTAPHACRLDMDRTIDRLTVSADSLDLAGFTLTAISRTDVTGGVFGKGTLASDIQNLDHALFLDSMTLVMTVNSLRRHDGGNRFEGPLSILCDSGGTFRMADLEGDTFLAPVHIVNSSTRRFDLAYSGHSFFAGDLTLDNSGTGGASIHHLLTGTSSVTMAAGAAIKSNGFSNGPLRINRFTQLGSETNDSLAPISFIGINTQIGGGLRMASTVTDIRLDTCTIAGASNLWALDDIDFDEVRFTGSSARIEGLNRILLTGRNTFAGNTTLTLNGSTNKTWNGGNRFNGPTAIINRGFGRLQMGNVEGDTFLSTLRLVVLDTGTIRFSNNGASRVEGNITLEHSGVGGITFGQGNGSVDLVGGNLLNGGFAGGEIRMERVTQTGATGNDAFSPTLLNLFHTELDGGLNVSPTVGEIILDSCRIDGNVVLNGAAGQNLDLRDRCALAYTTGTVRIVVQDDANVTWDGGCTFGDLRIELPGSFNLRLANTEGDTCLGDVELIATSTGQIEFGYNGNNKVVGDLTVTNSGTGGITLAERNGTLSLDGDLLTGGFTNGEFRMERVTQVGGTSNGSFNPTTFVGQLLDLDAGLSITTTSGQLRLEDCYIDGNVYMEAAEDQTFNIVNPCGLAMTSGLAEIVYNSVGNTTWNGPTRFGALTVDVLKSGRLRMGGLNGDTCIGDVALNVQGAGQLEFAYNGESLVDGDLTLNCSGSGGMSLAEGTGTLEVRGSLLTDGFAGGELRMERVVQNGGTANGAFTPTLFYGLELDLDAGLDVRTSSSSITFNASAVDGDVYLQPATDQQLTLTGSNAFSATSGSTEIRLNNTASGTTWAGGNTFGDVAIHHAGSTQLRTSSTTGSTFLGDVLLSAESTGMVQFAYDGVCSIAGDLRINCSGTGGMSICQRDGTLSVGGNILSDGFSNGLLNMERVTQVAATANGSFSPTSANWEACSFAGSINLSTTDAGSTLELDGCTLSGNSNVLSAAGALDLNNSNQIGSSGGVSSLTSRASTNINWEGGNSFGPVHIVHNGNGRLRIGSTSGNTYADSVHFQATGSGGLEVAFAGTNTFQGSINTTGSLQSIAFGGASAERCVFQGASRGIYGDAAFPPNFDRVVLDLDPGNSLNLGVATEVSDSLILQSGIIETSGTNILILTDESTYTSLGSSTSFVAGPMRQVMSNNAATRWVLNFPVGKGSTWRPVVLEVSHSANTAFRYDVELVDASAAALGWTLPTDIDSVSDLRYWTIERAIDATGIASDANLRLASGQEPQVTLQFETDENVTQPSVLRVVKNTSANPSDWIDIGGSGQPAEAGGAAVSGSITSTSSPSAFDGFSTFGLGFGNFDALPVTLLDFDAFASGENAEIHWSTAASWNHRAFHLDVSTDGLAYAPLVRMEGPAQSSTFRAYQHTDEGPHQGLRYYRLLEESLDGVKSILGYAVVQFEADAPSGAQALRLGPNPCSGVCRVYGPMVEDVQSPMPWELVDAWGRVVHQGTWIPQEFPEIDLSEQTSGVYLLRSPLGAFKSVRVLRKH